MDAIIKKTMPPQMVKPGASRLHVRMVGTVATLTLVPAVLWVIFSALMVHGVVQSWFSEPVRTAVTDAQTVAQSYLEEHRQVIRVDLLAMAADIDRQATLLFADPTDLGRFLDTQSFLRNIFEAVIFDNQGRVIARGGVGLGFTPDELPPGLLASVTVGDPTVFTNPNDSEKIQAVARLQGLGEWYLYVNRAVDARVLAYLERARDAATNYSALEAEQGALQRKFLLIYGLLSLVVVGAAVGLGLHFAGQMMRPIEQLAIAATAVREGDLTARMNEAQDLDEFADLARTFNRMTSELEAQRRELQINARTAAWADVARRVAHEIKNPLTPIQLSTERLRRRFLKFIPEADQAVYTQCIDTIIRHVGDIGRMVGEFASFARMPGAVLVPDDLGALIRDIVTLHQADANDVRLDLAGPAVERGAPLPVMMDAGQLRQALTNLILNARQAVQERVGQTPTPPGRVLVYVDSDADHYMISVLDNGPGFPTTIPMDRFGEPYVTFKEKGSGLGLAIVKKIIQDHKGAMRLNGPDGIRARAGWGEDGAIATLMIPISLEVDRNLTQDQSYAA
jgi:nitrogen fixation/metabolism regulation signal transduction histidine kinase